MTINIANAVQKYGPLKSISKGTDKQRCARVTQICILQCKQTIINDNKLRIYFICLLLSLQFDTSLSVWISYRFVEVSNPLVTTFDVISYHFL